MQGVARTRDAFQLRTARLLDPAALIIFFRSRGARSLLKPSEFEKLLWNIQMELGEVLWDERVATTIRIEIVQAIPGFLARTYETASNADVALNMFWDGAIYTPHKPADLPDSLLDAIAEALTEQLSAANPFVQFSALHGLNHFKDRRSEQTLRDFIATSNDASLIEYARGALRHEHM